MSLKRAGPLAGGVASRCRVLVGYGDGLCRCEGAVAAAKVAG